MKGIFHTLLEELDHKQPLVLATILSKKGSAPQVPGASAIFSNGTLLYGTLGGGVLEGDATLKSIKLSGNKNSLLYEYDLDSDITSVEGAICGGSALLLMDADPATNIDAFRDLNSSLSRGRPGILATLLRENEPLRNHALEIKRFWVEKGSETSASHPEIQQDILSEMPACLDKRACMHVKKPESLSVFLEPVYPLPKLYIAGAGHIGKALAHMGNLLDFEVTVIDDRAEYANLDNIPEADHIIADPIGATLNKIPKTGDTYIVIVTRGHRDDADALKACIDSDIPYIGMIGSKKKIRLMRKRFLEEGWATEEQMNRVHAPVGLEIGSKTVQEIAISISAQLVQIRSRNRPAAKSHHISAIVLAAGESSRMGKPKMLLPYGDNSIIETVISQVQESAVHKTYVVLGSDNKAIGSRIQGLDAETVLNSRYKDGMLSSVQEGLKTMPDSTEAVMLLLGDQPMIGSAVMNRMIDSYKASDKEILVASHRGKRGHPILFGRTYFREVLEFTANQSLRDLLAQHPDDIEEVETENTGILRDIDTEIDYRNALKQQWI